MMRSLAGRPALVASASLVSGMANQNSNSPAAATPASVKKAALYPALTTTKPATVVDSAAPIPCAVMTAPCARLKRPVPRIRSATMIGKIAP